MFSGKDRILTVKIDGELDHHSSDSIRRKIEREISIRNYIDIIFDFSSLSFMDSSGIGLIMGRYKHAEKLGGRVVIASARPDIRRIIEISGLHKICGCYDNTQAAEKALYAMRKPPGKSKTPVISDGSSITDISDISDFSDWRGQHGLEQ